MKRENYSKRIIQKAIGLNVFWQILPLVCGIYAVPYAIDLFGLELFTIYSLALGFVVGLNYLHFGVATSVNRDLASNIKDINLRSSIFWTGLISMTLIGLVIVISLSLIFPIYVNQLNTQSNEIISITQSFFGKIILQTPIILTIIFLRSVLESDLKFEVTASNRAILNSTLLCSPLIVDLLNMPFVYLAEVFLIIHSLALLNLTYKSRNYFKELIPSFSFKVFVNLFKSGGSLTLISLSMLVFLYCDRYVVSISVDLSNASYFIVPLDLLLRLSFIYGSVSAVFFPVFSQLYGEKNFSEFYKIIFVSYWLIFFVLCSITFGLVLFSYDLLSLWLGKEFSAQANLVTIILVFGILLTGLTAIPFKALVSLKQEKVLGYSYFFSSFFYVYLSYELIANFGIMGAASAFLIRAIIELSYLNGLLIYRISKASLEFNYGLYKFLLISFSPIILFFPIFLMKFNMYIKFIFLAIFVMIFFIIISRLLKELETKNSKKLSI